MKNNQIIKNIIEDSLIEIKPTHQETQRINEFIKDFLKNINKKIKKNKSEADVHIGGSVAKDTLIKKSKYDIDVFVRFGKKHWKQDISKLLKKILPTKVMKIHGSRDYFSIKQGDIEFEIIPCLKIDKPEQAQNITDLSYFHVNYVKNKLRKNKKLADEIRLAKAFAYYQECYGAESYINGFSGYALELLIIYYKSFMNFIKAMSKLKLDSKDKIGLRDKLIIDMDKSYKNKNQIIEELNSSKLQGPVILIDPTFKQRNALAALSSQTLKKFQLYCKMFLKNPDIDFFILKNKAQELREKHNRDLIEIEITTNKQKGDIAGTKLKKFYNYFANELKNNFDIKVKDFEYYEKENKGKMFFVLKQKKSIVFNGPPVKMKKQFEKFKKKHKKIIIKNSRAYAIEKPINLKQLLDSYKKDKHKKKVLREMDIKIHF